MIAQLGSYSTEGPNFSLRTMSFASTDWREWRATFGTKRLDNAVFKRYIDAYSHQAGVDAVFERHIEQ